jgi:mono/diheme cytochrome c family protein
MVTLVLQGISYARPGAAWLYRLSLAGTLGVLVVAGHLGGNLTHGAGYLVENAPAFIRDLLEPASFARVVPASALNEQQQFYADKVEPVFKAKCYRCHGPDKQKGGFRLDDPAVAMRGGSSGKPAIKSGDVLGSNLARLILLPPDHDDVMPPNGKDPLTLEELMHIVHWIRSGAAFAGQSVARQRE